MCGIAGILRFNDDSIDVATVLRMRDSLAHRGPNGYGIYTDNRIALAHRRLSIIDLSENASQPFISADGRYAITFNGEIYNYKEFIPELKAKGVQFRSSSDTEVLLYLYIHYGTAMLNRLNGIWAFAIWDKVERKLFMCRDRLGAKPLYYTIWGETLYFASEPKALFTAGVPISIEEKNTYELFFYRYIAGANTLFKNVQKLLPGHYMYVSADGKTDITRYWHLGQIAANTKIEGNPYEWFSDRFDNSVRYRMVSDVPVGVLLSAGLDSTSIAHSLSKQGYRDMDTFTIQFLESHLNEAGLAKSFAENLGYKSHTLLVEGELLYNSLLKAVWGSDVPLVHMSEPHLVAISSYAKDYVTVLLSGEGADELMGGYVRYKPLKYWKEINLLSGLLRLPAFSKIPRINKLNRYIKERTVDDAILLNASNFFPDEFSEIQGDASLIYRKKVLDEAEEYMGDDVIKRALYLDQHTYLESLLERNDRTTMIAGIECREPYLDASIVEGLASLPPSYFVVGKKGKKILMNSVGKHLPEQIRNFRKIGLGVPWERHFRELPVFRDILKSVSSSEILNTGIFGYLEKEKIINDFFSGDNSNKLLVRFFFAMRLWEKEYFNKFNGGGTKNL